MGSWLATCVCCDIFIHRHSLEPSFQTCRKNIWAVYLWGGGIEGHGWETTLLMTGTFCPGSLKDSQVVETFEQRPTANSMSRVKIGYWLLSFSNKCLRSRDLSVMVGRGWPCSSSGLRLNPIITLYLRVWIGSTENLIRNLWSMDRWYFGIDIWLSAWNLDCQSLPVRQHPESSFRGQAKGRNAPR